jgi:hypothetical protein
MIHAKTFYYTQTLRFLQICYTKSHEGIPLVSLVAG